MRRSRLINALLAFISVAIAGAVFGYWVIATSQGSLWLLETVPRTVGADLSIGQVEGRFLNRLRLTGLRLTLDRRTVQVDRLELEWRPQRLLAGKVYIRDVSLAGVRIQDDTPQDNKPTALSWPRLSRKLQLLDATIERLQLAGLSYRRLEDKPLRVSSLSGSFTWHNGVLSGEEFTLESPGGVASGRLSAGFGEPSLSGKILLLPATPLWSMDQLTVLLEPGKGANKGLTTRMTLSAATGSQQLLALSGEAGLTDGRLTLSQVRLTRPDHRGEISIDGAVTSSGEELLLNFHLALDGLNLSPPLQQATNLSGTLSLSGTPEQYRGKLTLANQGPGWQTASLEASFQGDTGKITVPQLSASIMDGTVSGNLSYSWRNGSLLTGKLTARGLNPSRLDPGWQGVVNAVATSTLRRDSDQSLTGTVRGELLQSELHGQRLTGALHAELTDAGMLVKMLKLQGKGFELHGSGNLQQRLSLAANISELGHLVPHTSGAVKGNGWIRLRNGRLSGAGRATAARLSIGETTVSSARLTARLAEGAAYPLDITLSLRDLTAAGQTIPVADLAVHGTLPRHDLSVTLRSQQMQAHLRLTAGYRSGVWQGVINSLIGNDRQEPWKLARPAPFAISSTRIHLEPLQLTSGGAEQLQFAADILLSPLRGSVHTNWQAINLPRFNPFIAKGRLSGISQGNLSLQINGKRLNIAGNGSAEGSYTGDKGTVAIRSATFAITGDQNGIHADATIATAGGGNATLTLDSPEPLHLAVPRKGSFSAQISRFDSSYLAPWFPEGTSLKGEITAALDGTFLPGQRFTVSGDSTIRDGAVIRGDQTIPFTSAAASWHWHDRSLAGKLALATADHGQLNGTFRLPLPAALPLALEQAGTLEAALAGQIKGKQLFAIITPEMSQEYQSVQLSLSGTPAHHMVEASVATISTEGRLKLLAGYDRGTWQGEITRLDGHNGATLWGIRQPAAFTLNRERMALTGLQFRSGQAEIVDLSANLSLAPLTGTVDMEWRDLSLSRAGGFLPGRELQGVSSGTLRLERRGTSTRITGAATAQGVYRDEGISVRFHEAQATVEGDQNGLRASMTVQIGEGGHAVLQVASTSPLTAALPEQGTFSASLNNLDSRLADCWLPKGISLQGKLNGTLEGKLLPGGHFAMTGIGAVADGAVQHRQPEGDLKVSFSSAAVHWDWQGQTLSGRLLLATADHGEVNGTFLLPFPAMLPLAFDRTRELSATLHGSMREQGMVALLFPDAVQESSGELAVALELLGTTNDPLLEGTLELSRASAYLPGSGIKLKDIRVAAHLAPEMIVVDSFRAVSGSGHLEGKAIIDLKGWEVSGYRGSVTGDNFQAVNFPELILHVTPDLTFSGDRQKVTIRGDLLLPEVRFESTSSRTLVVASSDVTFEGRTEPHTKSRTLRLDGQIRLRMGDKVFVKLDGIDTRLGGSMELTFDRIDNITSSGEIKLLDGRYRTYGVNLDIQRGRIFFAGGPLYSPTLDILAIRRIGAVKAGVMVTGRLQQPIIRLYSEPSMPDVDILAYIVLGHPLGSKGQQVSILTQAAGALLTSGQAADLQNQIKQQLGFSTLEIQSGVSSQTSTSDYQPLSASNSSGTLASQEPGVTETVLTIGKYLTPELYVSYGKSLFSGSNLFRIRYDISKQWQIESQAGNESGVDLYYKIEFGAR
jgi:autotransporter translocation and assembly factor TamB